MTQNEQDENAHDQITKQVSASRYTPEPWKRVLGADTHHVKRGDNGQMIAGVTMGIDDYDRAMDCVNALAGMNPEAVAGLVDACAWYLSVNSCENRAKMRAALAALKGSK